MADLTDRQATHVQSQEPGSRHVGQNSVRHCAVLAEQSDMVSEQTIADGPGVGSDDGSGEGAKLGAEVGRGVGSCDGPGLGARLGAELGSGVGSAVGVRQKPHSKSHMPGYEHVGQNSVAQLAVFEAQASPIV